MFSCPAGTEMVHFPALPSPPYGFRWRYGGITRRGLPHSEIPGSQLVCSSPRLIAAYRVLHRLLAPRHSPYALSSLIIGIETDSVTKPSLLWKKTRVLRPCPSLFPPSQQHCACLWIGKNYRLQDIQLSKNQPAMILPETLSSTSADRSLRSRLQWTTFAQRSLACQPELGRPLSAHLRAKRYSGHPSPTFTSKGWWRIPGSNR